MALSQLLSLSLLIGFLSGIVMQVSTIFLNSHRRLRYGYTFAVFSSGLIWGVGFLIMSFFLYTSQGGFSENAIKVLMVRLGVGLPLASIVFEICYAKFLGFREGRSRNPGDPD